METSGNYTKFKVVCCIVAKYNTWKIMPSVCCKNWCNNVVSVKCYAEDYLHKLNRIELNRYNTELENELKV